MATKDRNGEPKKSSFWFERYSDGDIRYWKWPATVLAVFVGLVLFINVFVTPAMYWQYRHDKDRCELQAEVKHIDSRYTWFAGCVVFYDKGISRSDVNLNVTQKEKDGVPRG